jgi:hypothetical protein
VPPVRLNELQGKLGGDSPVCAGSQAPDDGSKEGDLSRGLGGGSCRFLKALVEWACARVDALGPIVAIISPASYFPFNSDIAIVGDSK